MHTATLAPSSDPSAFVTLAAALPERQGPANLRAEAAGLNELSKVLATEPSMAVSSVLEIARALCRAGSAGVSLLRLNRAGETVVRWEAIDGALSLYEGIDMPRQGTPCGHSLDARAAMLVSRPARLFDGLMNTRPSIVEYLVIPLCDASNEVLGTIWLAHHDRSSHFSADDARIVEQLAHQLVLGMKLQEHATHRDQAVKLLQSHQIAQGNLVARALERERTRRKQAQVAERKARRALAASRAMVLEVNHRTKNTLQAAAAMLSLQARASSSGEVRDALLESRARLHALTVVHAMLCQSRDGEQTVRIEQLLQSVCDAVRDSYGRMKPGVTLTLAADVLSLSVSDAVSIAMLVNEAITNSYKHAFPGEAVGEIAVHLHDNVESSLVLRIADTGVGANLTAVAGGIGMTLIRKLAESLHGVLDLSTSTAGTGTQVMLTIDRAVAGAQQSLPPSPPPRINVRQRTD